MGSSNSTLTGALLNGGGCICFTDGILRRLLSIRESKKQNRLPPPVGKPRHFLGPHEPPHTLLISLREVPDVPGVEKQL